MHLFNLLQIIDFKNYHFFDSADFFDLIIRYGFNLFVCYIIVRGIYYPLHRNKDYFFTYFLFNAIIFMLAYMMNNVKLEMGVAFGLFAVFSILRYRTISVSIKEMAYLFTVISIAAINSLSSKKISVAELILANTIVVGIVYILEKKWLVKHASYKIVTYDRIDLIKPEKHSEMMADLRARTGLPVHRFEIGRIDFLRDTARLKVFYFSERNEDDIELNMDDDD